MRKKLLVTFILFILIIYLTSCSSPGTKIISDEITGSDGTNTYLLENNVINGNINALTLKIQISNLGDSKVTVIWKVEGKEVMRNGALTPLSGDYYTTGVVLSGGIIPSGKYSCEILINDRLYKTINFEIKQEN
jgi:hypothetical protein